MSFPDASRRGDRCSPARSSHLGRSRRPTLDGRAGGRRRSTGATGWPTTPGSARSRTEVLRHRAQDRQRGGPAGRGRRHGRSTFDYLIQTTTDYALLDEIAFRTGFEWRVEDNTLQLQAAQHDQVGRAHVRRRHPPPQGPLHGGRAGHGRQRALLGSADEASGRRQDHRQQHADARARRAARATSAPTAGPRPRRSAASSGRARSSPSAATRPQQLAQALGAARRHRRPRDPLRGDRATRRSRPAPR